MVNVVLVHPQIPQNTGNIIRLCANTGAGLHLVKPLGFPIDHAKMRRAGLDYHDISSMQLHESWQAFLVAHPGGNKYALTTRGKRSPYEVKFAPDDYLVFGSETAGLPDDVRAQFAPEHCIRLPMMPNNRSLNLSNSVAITVYEAWRQMGFEGASS
jgi:tRNA (cytidine/uridine-2'-O-)-methyltransferase